ncbi:MAG: fibrobacter succinogenes major paralogous domain-containing protein [Dysgonamonadaceae bacterium]|jgi:uncharacterized protein (TIGR02145 family)|nr:fibrobacter succinogenes major paralogous domain-containing protein [Dysgonamonadaceae bacterium]
MKRIFLNIAIIVMFAAGAQAQVTIGSLDDPQPFSVLELISNSGGLRLPQLDTDQRDALDFEGHADEALGLQIFNTTTKCVETWNGVEWIAACFTCPACPSGQVSDYECNCYTYSEFGDAGTWMTQNLRSTKYSDGTVLTLSSDYNYPTEGNVTPTSAKFDAHPEYGLLYSWAAASGRTGVSTNEGATDHAVHQGICPKGWHLPSDKEWSQLESEITNNNTNNKYGTGSFAGSNMKSQTPVVSDNTPFTSDGTSNTPANNGFNALLVGIVNGSSASSYGSGAIFWSSSSGNTNLSWYRSLSVGEIGVRRLGNSKAILYSVRCKK